LSILLDLSRMAGLTVIGGNHHINPVPVMLEVIGMKLGILAVAFVAAHRIRFKPLIKALRCNPSLYSLF